MLGMLALCGIGPEDMASGRPASRMIYPMSSFGIAWVAITVQVPCVVPQGRASVVLIY